MKRLLFLFAAFTFVAAAQAQDITLDGVVGLSQTGSGITLDGSSIELNGVTLTCDVLVINSSVRSIKIIGGVKMIFKNLSIIRVPAP